jgi:hypothetical protein
MVLPPFGGMTTNPISTLLGNSIAWTARKRSGNPHTLRFKEDMYCIKVIVEGRLRDKRLRDLQNRTLELLSRLEASDCEIVEIVQE